MGLGSLHTVYKLGSSVWNLEEGRGPQSLAGSCREIDEL